MWAMYFNDSIFTNQKIEERLKPNEWMISARESNNSIAIDIRTDYVWGNFFSIEPQKIGQTFIRGFFFKF